MSETDLTFILSEKQVAQIKAWMGEHDARECTLPIKCGHRYCGAIGGRYSVTFTQTGIGCMVQVACVCGKDFDATDYDEW